MMKNLGNNIISFNLDTTFLTGIHGAKEYAVGKYLEVTGFHIIDSSKSMIIAKIPDDWTMRFQYGDDTALAGLYDENGNLRIENFVYGDKITCERTNFKCRYEVYIATINSNQNTYMVDNARGKKKVFSVLPYTDLKQIGMAKKVMQKRFPEMDNPLAYWDRVSK